MTHQPANTLRDKITIENIWAIGPNNFLETTIVEWLLNKKSISQQCDFFWLVIAQSLIEKKTSCTNFLAEGHTSIDFFFKF